MYFFKISQTLKCLDMHCLGQNTVTLSDKGLAKIAVDCFTSHVGEHRTVRGLWKRQDIPCLFKIPTVQQSAETEMPFVYVTLATHITLAMAGYTPCLFRYITIGLVRHNRKHVSQSERRLVKPQRPCTDLCAEPVGVWNRLKLSRVLPLVAMLKLVRLKSRTYTSWIISCLRQRFCVELGETRRPWVD